MTTWLENCNSILPKEEFPIHKKCLVCGKNTKESYFNLQYHRQEGHFEYEVVHQRCFLNGELKYNYSTRIIYWSHVGESDEQA